MTGRFIAVVGPSGVGKDSVMEGLAAVEPRIALARRVISRPSEAGGEDFDGVTEAEFATRAARGDFALWWPAHGLHYGIPNQVDDLLISGQDVLANLSRAVLEQAEARFDKTAVILLTAPADVLAARQIVWAGFGASQSATLKTSGRSEQAGILYVAGACVRKRPLSSQTSSSVVSHPAP